MPTSYLARVTTGASDPLDAAYTRSDAGARAAQLHGCMVTSAESLRRSLGPWALGK